MRTANTLIVVMILLTGLMACAKPAPQQKLTIERHKAVLLTGVVETINLKTRMLTLRDEQGKTAQVQAGEAVVNLPQIRVGDRVEVEYVESLTIRKADRGEGGEGPRTSIAGSVEPGDKPAGLHLAQTSTSAQIVAIDTVRGSVTLRMPDRSILVVKAREPENLKRVKAGETIIITFTEAMAISVKPVTP